MGRIHAIRQNGEVLTNIAVFDWLLWPASFRHVTEFWNFMNLTSVIFCYKFLAWNWVCRLSGHCMKKLVWDGCMPLPTTNRYVEYISLNICLATHIHEIVLLSIIALLDIWDPRFYCKHMFSISIIRFWTLPFPAACWNSFRRLIVGFLTILRWSPKILFSCQWASIADAVYDFWAKYRLPVTGICLILLYQSEGHFTLQLEGLWPLKSWISHWWKMPRPSYFTSH